MAPKASALQETQWQGSIKVLQLNASKVGALSAPLIATCPEKDLKGCGAPLHSSRLIYPVECTIHNPVLLLWYSMRCLYWRKSLHAAASRLRPPTSVGAYGLRVMPERHF